jgi:branched-chain amino acid transport system permease protein
MDEVLQQVINALAVGSIYALIALGVAIVFSILNLVNFAHGEFMTIAGYTMFYLATGGVPWVLIVPAAILTAALSAAILERLAFRPIRGAAIATQLLASFAVSFAIQNALQLSVGARPKALSYPSWTQSNFEVGSLSVQWLDLTTFVVTILVLVGLTVFLRRTTTGLAMRSAASDFPTTRLMGIPANRVVVVAFLISGALAGLAAVFYFGSSSVVNPTSGFSPLLKGFIAAVIGGLGSLPGAVLGGFFLGALQVAAYAVLPGSLTGTVDGVVFGIVIVTLLVRPSGILGVKTAFSRV